MLKRTCRAIRKVGSGAPRGLEVSLATQGPFVPMCFSFLEMVQPPFGWPAKRCAGRASRWGAWVARAGGGGLHRLVAWAGVDLPRGEHRVHDARLHAEGARKGVGWVPGGGGVQRSGGVRG
eukprot:6178990-Pleurochrysis_carterae.AAC.1